MRVALDPSTLAATGRGAAASLRPAPPAAAKTRKNMTNLSLRLPVWLVLAALGLSAAGCRSTSRLERYDFHERTLAVLTSAPPRPDVFTADDFLLDPADPVGSIFRVGTAVAKEVAAEKARARLDSALRHVDVAGRVAERSLSRGAHYLRATPVDDPARADYLLDVRVRRYGIETRSWNSTSYFKLVADVILIDARTHRQIWKTRVKSKDPITPDMLLVDRATVNVVTAGALARLSVDDMVRALEGLANYSADRITSRLQRDLDKTRTRG